MITLLVRRKDEKMQLTDGQLPRLHNMRLSREARAKNDNGWDLLTQLQINPTKLTKWREASRRAFIHWFLKAETTYQEQHNKNELLAHLLQYVESGRFRYLSRIEEAWESVPAIEQTEADRNVYWIDRAPISVRLLEDKQSA